MKSIKNNLLALLSLAMVSTTLFLGACEKVIDLNIKDADTQLVIEGSVSNVPEYNYIKLNYSKSLSDANPFGIASGAIVSITDELGNNYPMTETEPGVYTNPTLIGVPYTNYSMNVQLDGKTYTANSFLPGATPIDTLISFKNEGGFFGEGYSVVVYFFDKGNETNFYRVRTYENGVRQNPLYIENDELRNGIYTGTPPLFNNTYNLGDTAVIQLMEVDQQVYKYFNSLADIIDPQNQPAAPGNPLTNITGGAIGVFAAYNIESDTLVIAD
jgi:hypothetical protein